MVFVDLSEAFDTVDWSTFWMSPRRYGCPETVVKLIQEFHDGIAIGGPITDPFEISHGKSKDLSWHLPCSLSFWQHLTVSEHLSAGVFIRIRSDGILFQLARLKASTPTRELCIRELLFADEGAIVAHTLAYTTDICKQFEQEQILF